MKITTAWLFGMGFKLGMRIHEILISTPGEMMDYASSYAIANGARQKNAFSFDEIMEWK